MNLAKQVLFMHIDRRFNFIDPLVGINSINQFVSLQVSCNFTVVVDDDLFSNGWITRVSPQKSLQLCWLLVEYVRWLSKFAQII